MQVPSQLLNIGRTTDFSMSPAYQWPRGLKKTVFVGAAILCLGIYALLATGVIGLLALLLDAIAG
jgi:hypothetical protein